MKISISGLELEEGKVKYDDDVFAGLVEKFQPSKQAPYYFELMHDDFQDADAIAIARDKILDLLILDIEKLENRLSRADNPDESALLQKCLKILETEKPVCDLPITETERTILTTLNPFSFKPTIVLDSLSVHVNELCNQVLEKSGMMFFYTAGKKEVRAWLVKKRSDAITCAGRIHSDLARGFIKAELVSFDDLMKSHSFQDAHSKGLTKLVDKDFPVPEKTILEIRFNV